MNYAVEVQNRFDILSESGDNEWENFKMSLTVTAEEVIPPLRKVQKNAKWMNDEILEMMEERRLIKDRDSIAYKEMNASVKQRCKKKKENWINKRCEEIERNISLSTRNVSKGIGLSLLSMLYN